MWSSVIVMKMFAGIALDLDNARHTIARGCLDLALFQHLTNQYGSDDDANLKQLLS